MVRLLRVSPLASRRKSSIPIPASESTRGYVTSYVKYIESGDTVSDTTIKGFQPNEQLLAENEITFGTTLIEVGPPFGQPPSC